MALIRDLIPTNLKSEKNKFLTDSSYNPQFEYSKTFTTKELTKYGLPQKTFFEHAEKMISKHGLPEVDITWLTPPQVADQVFNLVNSLDLPKIGVHFTPDANSQFMYSKVGLTIRTPINFSIETLKNKLNHEIQTHYLRHYNQSMQTWNTNSVVIDPKEFRLTEEGLANLHSYIEADGSIFRKTYLNYYASYLAQENSFAGLYAKLIELGCSQRLAWNLTLKQKRGLTDTSHPGGFSKNHVYFEGLVKVWQWLLDSNDPRLLYAGRISLKDISEVKKLEISPDVIYPTFFSNLDLYRQKIIELGKINLLKDLKI